MSEFKEEVFLLGGDVSDVPNAVTDESVADADLFHLPDVDDCPDNSDEAAHDDDDDFDGVAHGALTVTVLHPGLLEVLNTLVDLEHAQFE